MSTTTTSPPSKVTIAGVEDDKERKYPLIQPKGWKAPVTRYKLVLSQTLMSIDVAYIGVQQHLQDGVESTTGSFQKAVQHIESWMKEGKDRPVAVDPFNVVAGHDVPKSRVWVCYWTTNISDSDKTQVSSSVAQDQLRHSSMSAKLATLDLVKLYTTLSDPTIGLWLESFTCPPSRFETNYAGLHERPGFAALGHEREEHNLSAYWGAARDRISASSTDKFEVPTSTPSLTANSKENLDIPPIDPPEPKPGGLGQRLTGTNYDNMVHIRSGQCWAQCPADEEQSYLTELEPTLMAGMQYLWDNAQENGTIGLRFLRNLEPSSIHNNDANKHTSSSNSTTQPEEIKESSGAGFFRNLSDLERWSSRHKSHLKIFNGAHAHARQWGEGRKFMTWHEVAILKAGEVRLEYVNCTGRTGVVGWVQMKAEELR